ncbi:MAG TPA: hypothetical protein VFJ85_14530 [Acidimicrobiales bacterium]|nr:hypothetical protein [Acidimicrobiales bacterium]
MRLPRAADYLEALQDPASCFADPELAAAEPVLTPLGLPRAVSGNVAVVFRLDGAGGRAWAVRCFVRPLDQERARYEAVRDHLAGLDCTWKVGFDLQSRGIRIGGEWWPVLKMEWASGDSLLSYVERHLWDGPALAYLATRFAALTSTLRAEGVAHGDLQHGNILVAPGGDLRLVDYDGMYVPSLAGWTGTERGHRNYQHPGREVADFGPGLDHFSSWVVYASLSALAADPLLWGRLDGGEEALLLRHHDLEDPERSAAFAALEASTGPGVPELGRLLRSFLGRHPAAVPPLTMATAPAVVAGEAASEAVAAPVGVDRARSLYDALTTAHESGVAAPAPVDPGPARRVLVTGAALAVGGPAVLLAAGVGLPFALGCAVVAAGTAVTRALELCGAPVAGGDADVTPARSSPALEEAAGSLAALEREREEIAAGEAASVRRSDQERQRMRAREEQDLRAVDARLEAALAELTERERAVGKLEEEARAAALAELQGSVIDAQLEQHSLVAAAACGVSDRVVYRLAMDGVRTAADFTGVEVENAEAVVVRRDGRRLRMSGVDSAQAEAMQTWRRRVNGTAQLKVPHALPPERRAAIRTRHDALRAELGAEADALRAEAKRQADQIRTLWQAELDRVVHAQKDVEADAARRRVELDRRITMARKDVAEAQWHLGQHPGPAPAPAPADPVATLRRVILARPRSGRR